MNDLTQEQADRLAKWRWGETAQAFSQRDGYGPRKCCVESGNAVALCAPTFAAAFRASMQSPMTDKDADLEAKLRWGLSAAAWGVGGSRFVGPLHKPVGSCGLSEPWERAFGEADSFGVRSACGELGIGKWRSPKCPSGHQRCILCGYGIADWKTREVSGTVAWVAQQNIGCEWHLGINGLGWLVRIDASLVRERPRCTTLFVPAVGDNVRATFAIGAPGEEARLVRLEVIRPDLTRAEALAQAVALWGDRAYAFEAVGKAPLAVGCAGVVSGTGKTFREAFARATWNQACLSLATAFGAVGCAAVRERNKAAGQALMQPPPWAYPAAWRNAVMAAVEWANNNANPIALWDWTIPLSEALMNTVRGYHSDRQAWCEKSARKRQGGGTFAAAVCAAYERGRPGGGR